MSKKAVIYCRVSSKKQAQQGESLADQERVGRRIAMERGFEIVPDGKVFRESFTGQHQSRPVFDEAMEYIKKNSDDVDFFIILDIDRLTRGGSFHYLMAKNELLEHGVELLDSLGVIQPSQNTLEHHGFEYPWSRFSPSEGTELFRAQAGQYEVQQILTRLIGKEIELTNRGYKTRAPNDGFINQTTRTPEGKRRTVQVPDPQRAHFFKKMFELRAMGTMKDQEICDVVNGMGFRTKIKNKWDANREKVVGKTGGLQMTPKMLQKFIKRPAYCGIVCEKWTKMLPIYAQGEPIVSIETFNEANRGKIYIQQYDDGTLQMRSDYHPNKRSKKRTRNNPTYPFKNVIMCPECDSPFLGSASRGKNGKRFPSYHCTRGHKRYAVPKKEFDENVANFVKSLKFTDEFIDILHKKVLDVYRKRQKDLTLTSASIDENVAKLKAEKAQKLEAIVKVDSSVVRKNLEKQVEELIEQISEAEVQRAKTDVSEHDIEAFIQYVEFFVEHIHKLLLNADDMCVSQAMFGLLFEEFPSYEEVLNGTPKLSLVFATTKPQHDAEALLVTPRGIEPRFPP